MLKNSETGFFPRSILHVFLGFIFPCFVSALDSSSYAATEGARAALVAGAVNAITGEHYVAEIDEQIQAAHPLHLPRTYLSSHGTNKHSGWQLYHHLYAAYYVDEDEEPWRHRIQLIEPNGTTLHFERSERRHRNRPIIFNPINLSQARGVTNVGRGEISGRSNLKNIRVELSPNEKDLTVYGSDGAIRCYRRNRTPHHSMPKELFDDDAEAYYLLQWEKLPNQTKIHYGYGHRDRLNTVKTTNHNDAKTYASARISYHDNDVKIETSDGKIVNYHFSRRNEGSSLLLTHVTTPRVPQESLHYNERIREDGYTQGFLITDRQLPDFRRYKLEYYQLGHNRFSGTDIRLNENDPRLYRVKTLSAPVGQNADLLVTHRFLYLLRHNITQVRDIDNLITEYLYSPEHRLEKLVRYGPGGGVYNAERYVWADANLLCHTLLDNGQNPLVTRRFFYDDFGNVKEEKLYGSLTGQATAPLTIDAFGYPQENGVETYTIKRCHSQDRLNLLLREEEQNGKVTINNYLPNTSLLSSQFICDGSAIKIRRFFEYHDFVLIREIIDDGFTSDPSNLSGVKTRRIKIISPVPQGHPHQDMPQIIEEKYWDGNQEILLKKTVFSYTNDGLIEKQDIYDATNAYCYSLTMKYDSACRLKEETNALGQRAYYEYDNVGNQILSTDFCGRKTTRMRYDFSNRLVQVEETGNDGIQHTTHHRYDTKHNKIATIDPYGNETRYVPDPFGHIAETYFQPIPNAQGSLQHPITSSRYDSAGREISTTSPIGGVTNKRYNARHQVTYIEHPDKTTESFIYNLDGTLRSHINQAGAKTDYIYDFLGRMTTQTDPLGNVTTHVYDAFNLISITDAEGNTTTYTYDGAGRKIAQQRHDKCIEFSYDALGRMASVKEGNLLSLTDYDLLDRAIEEKQEDLNGTLLTRILHDYDPAGNPSKLTRFISGNESTEIFTYDSFNRLIKKTDPIGHITTWTYDESFTNAWGQRVLKKTETDPLGLETIEIHNALGQTAAIEKRNSTLLHREEMFYDLNGNLIQKVSTIIHPDKTAQVPTSWEYDIMGRVAKLTEADKRITQYEYTPTGLLHQTIKPDGVKITNTYDLLGRLESQIDSKSSVHYLYKYDRMGQLIAAIDQCTGEVTTRSYDPNGNLLHEKLGNNLAMTRTYDEQGRRKTLELPDKRTIFYDYDALHLRTVAFDEWKHHFSAYDHDGNLLVEDQIGGHRITRDYDLTGRPLSFHAGYFHQEVDYDPVGNLVKSRFSDGETTYGYDPLYHLISENGLSNHSYLYDSNHNRHQKDRQSYPIDNLNQVPSIYNYDRNGNPEGFDGVQYTYDGFDRLTSIVTPTTCIRYHYDFDHRRLTKTVLQKSPDWQTIQTLYFLYDGNKEIGSFDSQGTLLELRILGLPRESEHNSSILFELHGQTLIPIHDLSGNVIAVLSPKTGNLQRFHYSAFGEEPVPSDIPWRFSSKRYDPESSLYYFGRRYYDPSLGRWLTTDPQGYDDGMNLYAFVLNNPLTHYDAYGLWTSPPMAIPGICLPPDETTLENRQQTLVGAAHGVPEGILNITHDLSRVALAIEATQFPQCLEYATGSRSFTQDWNNLERSHQSVLQSTDNFMHHILKGDVNNSYYQQFRSFSSTATEIASTWWIGGASAVRGVNTLAKAEYPLIHGVGTLRVASSTVAVAESRAVVSAGERAATRALTEVKNVGFKSTRNRLIPNSNATGGHTEFRRDLTGKISHYETFRSQTNSFDPKPWESVKRFDRTGKSHRNTILKKDVPTPHIHDPKTPGGIRPAEIWEIPE